MNRIAVFGAGTMGLGIVQTALSKGLEVVVLDVFDKNHGLLEKTKERLWREMYLEKIDKTTLRYASAAEVEDVFGKVVWLDNSEKNWGALCQCDAVVEAVFENIDVKTALFQAIEGYVGDNTPIYSNTSTINIAQLSKALKHPERFMGMHFFNPVPRMNLIEMIPHAGTSKETIAEANKFAEILEKKHYLAPDIPGFVVNRIAVPMIIYFYQELEKGASLKEIDKAFITGTWVIHEPSRRIVESMIRDAKGILEKDQLDAPVKVGTAEVDALMTLGTTFRSGPFELDKALADLDAGKTTAANLKFKMGPGQFTDLVGLDVAMDCIKSFGRQEPNSDRWQIPKALEEMVGQKKLGQKTGKGFYEHGARVDVERLPDNYVKITFGDGAGNVLSTGLLKKLSKTFETLRNEKIKAIFLEGRGKHFAVGANIKEFPLCFRSGVKIASINTAFRDLMFYISVCKAPVVAVVRGMALGGGYELALACDYIIAEEGSEVGLPEMTLGLLPGAGGTQRLPRRVGLAKGLEFILRAKPRKAVRPWVDTVVMPGTPLEYLKYFGDQAAKKKSEILKYSLSEYLKSRWVLLKSRLLWEAKQGNMPVSHKLIDYAVLNGNQKYLLLGLNDEYEAFKMAFMTRDAEEGIRAFMEKRKPNFIGK